MGPLESSLPASGKQRKSVPFVALRGLLTVLVMSTALVGAVVASPLDDAGKAYAGGDYANTLRLIRPLADQGVADAQFLLGSMYFSGKGVSKDYGEAVRWLRRAAQQDYALGQYVLGGMYYRGFGVTQSYVEAYKWLDLAASRLVISDEESAGKAIKEREFVATKMTRSQIAEAQKLAREWKPTK